MSDLDVNAFYVQCIMHGCTVKTKCWFDNDVCYVGFVESNIGFHLP